MAETTLGGRFRIQRRARSTAGWAALDAERGSWGEYSSMAIAPTLPRIYLVKK